MKCRECNEHADVKVYSQEKGRFVVFLLCEHHFKFWRKYSE